jgi:putative zinc finger protein
MAPTTDDRFAADPWTDRLSEYLDHELAPAEREALEAHLRGCAECTDTLAGLRRVSLRARALGDRPPARDLWPAIAAQLVDSRELRFRSPRRLSVPLPALAAAAVAFLVIGGSVVWLVRSPSGTVSSPSTPVAVTAPPPAAPPPASTAPSAQTAAVRAMPKYDAAVAELQQILDQSRSRLKPETVKVLEEKLALIDRAIVDAQEALARDPASVYLNDHLAETRLRKLELLRRAAALAASAS